MTVRDAAVADIVPKMSETRGLRQQQQPAPASTTSGTRCSSSSRRSSARKASASSCSRCARASSAAARTPTKKRCEMKKDEFDQAFERYLKERFKPFRDKERPADYGRDLSPNKEKTHFAEALSIAPSPSGDLIAAVTVNRKDRELDIVLISAKDGSIVRNLTSGFDKDYGLRPHRAARRAVRQMPWMAWSPKGDRLAYFVRTEKERTLIIQNVLTRKIEERIADEVGRRARVAELLARRPARSRSPALRGGIGDIFTVDLDDAGDHQPHRRRFRRLRADLLARRQVHRLQRARQREPEAVPARSRHEEEDAAHLRHRTTRRRRSSSTTTRSCSRRRPPTRPCRSSPKSPRTATSTTSGRST